jgi:acyl-CoA thioesterase YciA
MANNKWRSMNLLSTHLCKTSDVGFHGNLFGGQLLAWLDEAGAALSAEFTETGRIVTKHISEVNFQSPVRPGQLIKIYGKILKIGTTSITLEVEARRHSIYNGTQKPVCKCQMIFVRIDGDGESVPIPPHIHKKFKRPIEREKVSEYDSSSNTKN